MGDSDCTDDHIELVGISPRLHGAALQGRNHKALPAPGGTKGVLHHILPLPQLAKRSPSLLGQIELAVGIAGFRITDRNSGRLPLLMPDDFVIPIIFLGSGLPCKGCPHSQGGGRGVQIDVTPFQSQKFTNPKPRIQGNDNPLHAHIMRCVDSLFQTALLRPGKYAAVLLLILGKPDALNRVCRNDSIKNSLFQCNIQCVSHISESFRR